ncbi:2-hydroxyacyl-CoA dehydratase subunit D [Paenibacillus sp. TH7-28]
MGSIFSAKRKTISTLPRSTKLVNQMLMSYYRKIHKAKEDGIPVAWVSVDFPAYLLSAMDIIPVFPQVQASFQAQRKKVKKMMLELESKWEIPANICGEVKGMLGAVLFDSEISFDIPKPDVLLSANSSCSIMTKGFMYLKDYLNTELLFSDFPFVYGELGEDMVDYSAAQIERVVERLEQKFSRTLDLDKLTEIHANFYTSLKLWEEICKLNMEVPAPVECLDMFLFSTAMMIFGGEPELNELYRVLYNEIYEQIEWNRKQREHQEKYRILWHYLPIYSQKNFFKELFEKYGITVVTGTFFPLSDHPAVNYSFQYPITPEQLLEAKQSIPVSLVSMDRKEHFKEIALSVLELDVNRTIDFKNDKIMDLINNFNINGVVMHCDKSCRPQSLPQYELVRKLNEQLHLPVLIFDADTMDDRYFSPSQVLTRFEAFVEKMQAASIRI